LQIKPQPDRVASQLRSSLLQHAVILCCLIAAAGPAAATPTPAPAPTPAGINILTFHNDNMRSGLNPHETILTPANVNVRTFGKLFSYPVDGYLYAEPLYVSQLAIPGQGTHNVVYVASEHDSVYAFDADGLPTLPLWQKSFIDPANGITTVSGLNDVGCHNLVPEIGITGTPVISLDNQALYVVSETKNQNNGTFALELHALDLATGAEKFGGPVPISATVAGIGNGNDGHGNVSFVPMLALQRPALLFLNGMVYIAFGSNCDRGPYHGWVLAYDGLTLAQKAAFNTTPNGSEGGIWQSGNGPSASPFGNVFVGIGNGTFNGTTDYGDSFVKLDPNTLRVIDYFTPSDQALLSATDSDGGITGVVVLPDQPSGPATYERNQVGSILSAESRTDGEVLRVVRRRAGDWHSRHRVPDIRRAGFRLRPGLHRRGRRPAQSFPDLKRTHVGEVGRDQRPRFRLPRHQPRDLQQRQRRSNRLGARRERLWEPRSCGLARLWL